MPKIKPLLDPIATNKKYFRFEIPQIDGKAIAYSPGWYGYTAVQMAVPEVLLYNDVEGYGIAQVDDVVIPNQPLNEITEEEAGIILSEVAEKEEEGVYIGQSLEDRIEWNPEATVADVTESQTKEQEENGSEITLDDDGTAIVAKEVEPAVLGKGGKIEKEAVVEILAVNRPKENEVYIPDNQPTQKAYFCSTCHCFISYLPAASINAKQIVLQCANGHKNVILQEVEPAEKIKNGISWEN